MPTFGQKLVSFGELIFEKFGRKVEISEEKVAKNPLFLKSGQKSGQRKNAKNCEKWAKNGLFGAILGVLEGFWNGMYGRFSVLVKNPLFFSILIKKLKNNKRVKKNFWVFVHEHF